VIFENVYAYQDVLKEWKEENTQRKATTGIQHAAQRPRPELRFEWSSICQTKPPQRLSGVYILTVYTAS
jgi:hypothetical protein